jgi:hypothetical protein
MYYVPNEGMRYWDGEEWSESEPRSRDTEVAVVAEQPTANRAAGGNSVLPWLVAGVAMVAAAVMAALLVIGGSPGAELASASEASAGARASTPAASPPRATATKKTSRPSSTKPATRATSKPSRPPSTKPAPAQAPEPVSTFDDEYARIVAGRIVRDIATADERMLDRPDIGGDSAMAFLSKDMGNLEKAGLPDVKDRAHYVALVRTLGQFYDKAEWQLSEDQITEAAATYTVARKATSELLTILNPVLGTKHKLPAWSWL